MKRDFHSLTNEFSEWKLTAVQLRNLLLGLIIIKSNQRYLTHDTASLAMMMMMVANLGKVNHDGGSQAMTHATLLSFVAEFLFISFLAVSAVSV